MSERRAKDLEEVLAEAHDAARLYHETFTPVDESQIQAADDQMNVEFALAEVEAGAVSAHKQAFMLGCPNQPDASNCAMAAGQYLIDNELVMLDLFGTEDGRFLISTEGQVAAETIYVTDLHFEAGTSIEIAELGCTACGRCLQFVDAYGQVSMRPGEDS